MPAIQKNSAYFSRLSECFQPSEKSCFAPNASISGVSSCRRFGGCGLKKSWQNDPLTERSHAWIRIRDRYSDPFEIITFLQNTGQQIRTLREVVSTPKVSTQVVTLLHVHMRTSRCFVHMLRTLVRRLEHSFCGRNMYVDSVVRVESLYGGKIST